MRIIMSFTLRNLKRYCRDGAALFFSLLSVLIVVTLYVFFLADMQVQSIESAIGKADGIAPFIYDWIVGGLLCIPAVSVPLIVLTTRVDDAATGITDDLAVSPAGRGKLMLGYIFAAWIAGFAMTGLTLVLGELFIAAKGGAWLPIDSLLQMMGIAGVTILAFSGFSFFAVARLRTHSALMVVNTILNTLIGFFAGLYVPVGFLSEGVATAIKVFPLSHAAALLRRVIMTPSMDRLFADVPIDVAAKIRQNYGVDLVLWGHPLTGGEMLLILTGFGIVFYTGSAVLWREGKRQGGCVSNTD